MKTILIAGGNSGVGRQAAHDIVARGHRVVLLGRSQAKGEAALTSLGAPAERASFLAADLSTHDGVRHAAHRILGAHARLDAVLHTTGILTTEESRTTDGLHPFLAVNYLSRYHLTQLLLPALRLSPDPHVVMMTAAVPPTDGTDFSRFPHFEAFDFGRDRKPVQLANHHYAAHLTRTENGLAAAVVNAGMPRTDIMRAAPASMRIGAKILGPLIFDSVGKAAHNPVEATLRDDWETPAYWGKPGRFEQRTPITLDASTTERLMNISHALTGA
ncbi:SDR family NAD(P)-dependent oxidoreductase [Streptomyces sp. NBC_00059]|uniref:SDR family NAD(P)-dependent oxidoreductase n=1 Tax=Streptomyces sp. NBC_00059 TaxID=2975635 RepID=UPI00224D9364|nr:SDR family NAD(P)-dependent oxidoreductase [Streptomyces sp. NBC_00059]MCX5414854.1 SDR family NAD(P)-dependent oxidoreductase [Streptomyces sp. NBC_00059]